MKLEKSYNTKQYFHSFYRQNHALLVLSFLFTVICFPREFDRVLAVRTGN